MESSFEQNKNVLAYELGIMAESECTTDHIKRIEELANEWNVSPDELLDYYKKLEIQWKEHLHLKWVKAGVMPQ